MPAVRGGPAWARRLLRRVLPKEERGPVLEEMDRLHARRLERDGRARADLWYARHALLFPVRLWGDSLRTGWGGGRAWLAGLAREFRYAGRGLRRRPAYAWAVVLTLGVALGGLATVYNVANWVLLRPVPGVMDADGLATVRLEMGGPSSPSFPISAPDLEDVGESLAAVSGLAGAVDVDVNVIRGSDADPRRMTATLVSPSYFPVLRMEARRGRLLDPGAAEADPRVAVVSHRLWRSAWNGSPDAIGAVVRVNGEPFTVIGVAPEGFRGAELPGRSDLWLPAAAAPVVDPSRGDDAVARRGATLYNRMIARLEPGAGPAAIPPQFESAIERIRREHSRHSFMANFGVGAYAGIGLEPRVRGPVRRTLGLLAGAAALLLMLALANVANLGLSRVLGRSDSNGVRLALGASRLQVARGILADHLLLSVIGGALGLLLAAATTRILGTVSLSALGASLEGIRLGGRVAVFTGLAALAAGLVAGLVPAAAATVGRRLPASLAGRRHGSRSATRLQTVMAATQVALSIVLLVSAGLLVRTVLNLQRVDLGFEPAGAVRFAIDPGPQGYDDDEVGALLERLRLALEASPDIEAAGYSAFTPLGTSFLTYAFWPSDRPRSGQPVVGARLDVSAGLMEAMGVRLLAGRTLRPEEVRAVGGGGDTGEMGRSEAGRDEAGGALPVVISAALARAVFPDAAPSSAVDRTFEGWRGEQSRVVGVVADPQITGPGSIDPPPAIFLPWSGPTYGATTFWVRGPAGTARLAEQVERAVRSLDPTLPVFDLRTVREQVDRLIVEQRVVGGLALALALIGLLLAAIGLNGLLWYSVNQRRREIGIRAALGASPARLTGTTVRRGMTATLAGAAVGVAASVFVGRLVESRLFGVDRVDPLVYVTGVALLLAVAAAASWPPARQATRIAPREALNAE